MGFFHYDLEELERHDKHYFALSKLFTQVVNTIILNILCKIVEILVQISSKITLLIDGTNNTECYMQIIYGDFSAKH